MRCERLTGGDPVGLAAELRALVPGGESVAGAVGEIIAAVRTGGDAAVLDYTSRFDTGGREPRPLRVAEDELDAAVDRLDPAVRRGIDAAIENVGLVAAAAPGVKATAEVELPDQVVWLRRAPVAAAGIYVPGGRASYPSTVVMGVVPARAAGVATVAVCAPPGPDAEVDGAVLAASRLAGASVVYRMGGAQAIAALACGTESVQAVDLIAGPGNLYVQEAKHQLSTQVGIDGFAGPSDLMVLAGEGAPPEPLAEDLLAQAEHGPGTIVVGVSTSTEVLDGLQARLQSEPDTGAVARLVQVKTIEDALALAEAFAPEHLQLVGDDAERLAPGVTRAGSLFTGAASGTAFGDYIAGSNHILPTGGAARFASALSPETFIRRFTEVRIVDPVPLAELAAPVARAEGFAQHARSMQARIRDNRQA